MNMRFAAAFAAFFTLSAPAFAHVGLEQAEATPGQTWRGVLRIGHGCAGSPTIRVEAKLPPQLAHPRPMAKPGWQIAVNGDTIIWSGGSLPDGHYDEFIFRAAVAKDAAIGPAPIPVIQTCEQGEHRWTDIAATGRDAGVQKSSALKSPAPVLQIVQNLTVSIEEPWLRATPKGSRVAGGFANVVNPGQADRLVSASFPSVAGRTEIHEMAMANGMMTMRPLPNGINVPANGRIDLKPGGFHLMLMDLKEPLVEGQSISGTLVFEKAGPVNVTFPVMAIGAPGPTHQHKH